MSMHQQQGRGRRHFLKATGAIGSAWLAGCAAPSSPPPAKSVGRVMIVGAGFAGATAARYLRLWSRESIEVMLVDREHQFVSCPISNLVLGGSRRMENITRSYDGLRAAGVRVMGDEVAAIDLERKRIKFAHRFADLSFDRLVIAPGIDYMHEQIEGYDEAARKTVLAAWKAGAETVALRRQLEAMRDGGTYILSIPLAPYRCPPGPYERACQVAWYFKQAKPRSKVLILDANPDVTSKPGLFKAAWKELYGGIIDYRPNSEVKSVDARTSTVRTDFETIRGDVLNILPPMQAAGIARAIGLTGKTGRWCDVDWLTMESTVSQGVHVLGDATLSAQGMPKSGQMANQHGKIAAAAIIEIMNGRPVDPAAAPGIINTCYSFVSDREAMHVASVHRYDVARKSMLPVTGAGGVSARHNDVEGLYGLAWARTLWDDTLGEQPAG